MPNVARLIALLGVDFTLCCTTVAVAQASLTMNRGVAVNRSVTNLLDNGRQGVRLDQRPGDGLLWLREANFARGIIELDIRGNDSLQRSFVGVAFHGQNDTTYEAVYFRPFNFRTEDPVRRVHAVQYIALPGYTWQKLRTEQPGTYEAAIRPAPDPNGWSHVRLEITSDQVSVFVNDIQAPILVVKRLSQRQKGQIGLWVGNKSGGDFANLTVLERGSATEDH